MTAVRHSAETEPTLDPERTAVARRNRRRRVAAGTLATAGSVAVVLLGGGRADAATTQSHATTKVATPVQAAQSTSYTIKRGDTLSGIAAKVHASVQALAAANGIANNDRIVAGQKLVIPAGAHTAGTAAHTSSTSGTLPTDLPKNSSRWALKPVFQKVAAQYGVSAALLQAMDWNESGWQNSVVSSTGAVGVGQLMPATVNFVNQNLVKTPLNPSVSSGNITMSAAYLAYLLHHTNGDYRTALAAYYQGLKSVQARGMYDDTKQYVNTVLALQRSYF